MRRLDIDIMDVPVPPPEVTAADLGVPAAGMMELLNTYAPIGVLAFVITLLITPLIRRLAISANIIDHPDSVRKQHDWPVAYLGGVAIFIGVLVAIVASFFLTGIADNYQNVPMAIIIGMIAITFTGLADDVWGWDPRLKIAGQLVAAAALALQDIGVRVADGLLHPLLGNAEEILITIGGMPIQNADVFYWVGTAIIAIFVLGGCNAANLIDGLDGLLSGVTGIVALGLLAIALLMATNARGGEDFESLAGTRIVLSLALLGAVLGFLPHNFNPASIFLGDCGSLLLGYLCVVVILMFGENGQTHLVFAGLIIFSLPIMDTVLAIIRRKMTGRSMSEPDHQHIHHQLKRALRGVRRAVFALYAITAAFTVLGVALAALVMLTELRVRIIYAIAIVLFGFVGALAIKAGRRVQYETPKPTPAPRTEAAATEPRGATTTKPSSESTTSASA